MANVGLVLAAVQPAHAAVVTSLVLSEGFDTVTPPALPAGWTATRVQGATADHTWETSTPSLTSDPNAASVGVHGHVTDMVLESAPFTAGPATRMRFFHRVNMQAMTGATSGDNLDGGVLEIKIGNAGYVDFVAAGGVFNAGEGYNKTISSSHGNPLGGRMGWAGIAQGSIHNGTLPSSANGQTVRLRWRLGTSNHPANAGGTTFFQSQAWIIDDFQVVSDQTTQTISFTSSAPVNPVVGATYTPTATATSGLPVAFSIAAGSSAVCSIGAANLVTFNASGSCVIQANQAGNGGFTAAPQVTQTVTVVGPAKTDQTISFTSSAPVNPQAFTMYTPTATATSSLPVTFSIAPGSVCSLTGGVVTFETPGPCTIQADQAGDGSFNAAPRVTQSMTVVKADQLVYFTSDAPVNPQVGTTYTPTAGTSSGGPLTLSIAAGSSSVCSIDAANLVTFNAVGSCVIQADQAGNSNLNPGQATQTVNVVAVRVNPVSKPAVARGGTTWLLRNSLTTGGADLGPFTYGTSPMVPLFGDWDANGSKTVGSFENGVFKLNNANDSSAADVTFTFGDPRGFPVAGDFNGDGYDDVAVFHNGTWEIHYLGIGAPPDVTFSFGPALAWPSVVPVAGDWDGDGVDGIGIFNNGAWSLKNVAAAGAADLSPNFAPGTDPYPVVGDWDGDGIDTVGVKSRTGTTWQLSNTNNAPTATVTFDFGQANTDLPFSWY